MTTLVSVMYPGGSENRFDLDYFLGKHIPLVRERWSPLGLKDVKVVKGTGTPDGGPAPFQVMALLTWDSADSFKKGAETHGDEIFGDIPNYTNSTPTVQISEFAE